MQKDSKQVLRVAIEWIKDLNHQASPISAFPILYSFVPGPMPNDKIVLLLFRRKDKIEGIPYAFFILGYGNEVFQVFLPSPERDQAINGKKITIMPYPIPRDIYPSEFGSAMRRILDLTGRDAVKDEACTITMGFEESHCN